MKSSLGQSADPPQRRSPKGKCQVTKPTTVVWNTLDYIQVPIELTTTVLGHAIYRHGDVPGLDSLMRGNVEFPEMVVQSPKYDDTLIYSRLGIVEGMYSGQWLHVPVSFQVGFGSVTSAYFSPRPKPGKIIYVNYKK